MFLNVVLIHVSKCCSGSGQETEVYAVLDQSFIACFCDCSLARELQVSGMSQQLKLQTLTETKSCRTVSAEMKVRGLFDDNWV